MTKTSQAYTRNTKAAETPQLPSRLVRLLYEARWLAMATLLVYLSLILLTYFGGGWVLDAQVEGVQQKADGVSKGTRGG